jgi:hypothetical protein
MPSIFAGAPCIASEDQRMSRVRFSTVTRCTAYGDAGLKGTSKRSSSSSPLTLVTIAPASFNSCRLSYATSRSCTTTCNFRGIASGRSPAMMRLAMFIAAAAPGTNDTVPPERCCTF